MRATLHFHFTDYCVLMQLRCPFSNLKYFLSVVYHGPQPDFQGIFHLQICSVELSKNKESSTWLKIIHENQANWSNWSNGPPFF